MKKADESKGKYLRKQHSRKEGNGMRTEREGSRGEKT